VQSAVLAGLLSSGRDVGDMGETPVFMLRYAVRRLGAGGAVYVGAGEGGVKLLFLDGTGYNAGAGLMRSAQAGPPKTAAIQAAGSCCRVSGVEEMYRQHLRTLGTGRPRVMGCGRLLHRVDSLYAPQEKPNGLTIVGDDFCDRFYLTDQTDESFEGERLEVLQLLAVMHLCGQRDIPAPAYLKALLRANGRDRLACAGGWKRRLPQLQQDTPLCDMIELPMLAVVLGRLAAEEGMTLSGWYNAQVKNHVLSKTSIACPFEKRGSVLRLLQQDEELSAAGGAFKREERDTTLYILPDEHRPLIHVYTGGFDAEFARSLCDEYLDKLKDMLR